MEIRNEDMEQTRITETQAVDAMLFDATEEALLDAIRASADPRLRPEDVRDASELLDGLEEHGQGYGYLGLRSELGSNVTEHREYPGKDRVRRRVDRAVVRAALDVGLTVRELFEWADSKLGRYFAEESGGWRRITGARRDRDEAAESMREMRRLQARGRW